MKLHTVFITYNRLELTKQAIQSYLHTVTVPHTIAVVDNASTDGTQQFLLEWEDFLQLLGPRAEYHFLPRNRYPGYATNLAWSYPLAAGATHLHRADNDFKFLPGWCDWVQAAFDTYDRLGQLGLRTGEEELWNPHNVGGNCIIRRELWDAGLRWDERPWPEIKTPGYTEDSFMSPAVAEMGWDWGRVKQPCIQSLSYEDPSDPYYQQTWRDRGINL